MPACPSPPRIALLEDGIAGTHAIASEWVAEACRAKGISPDAPVSGEEWIAGPAVTLRNIRLLARALADDPLERRAQAERRARSRLGARRSRRARPPYDGFDAALYGGISAETWLQPGIRRADVVAGGHQASFYRRRTPRGGVSLVLGAGNVASIPPMDILYKMFVDGSVVHPQDEPRQRVPRAAPRARVPPARSTRGTSQSCTAATEVGIVPLLPPDVADVHITGSDKTHDLIVWGPPGPGARGPQAPQRPAPQEAHHERAREREPRDGRARGPYSDDELASMAENVGRHDREQRLVQLQRRQAARHAQGLAAARQRSC